MQTQVIPVSMFQSNCVIVWDESGEGVVFDPGGGVPHITGFIDSKQIKVKGIFLTHGHVDHVAGTNHVKNHTSAPTYLHEADFPVAAATTRQCLMFGIPTEENPVIDHGLADGEHFEVGTLKFKALHTPGHSPGSTCFLFESPESLLVAGDLLFAGSIGRTDLVGGSPEQMKASLEIIKTLSDDLTVIPGHGPATTVGHEKRSNPYLTGHLFGW